MMALQNEKLRAEIQKQRVELEDTSMKLPFSVDAKFIVTFDFALESLFGPHRFLVRVESQCERRDDVCEQKDVDKRVPLGF